MTIGPTNKQLSFSSWLDSLVEKELRGTLAALRNGLMFEQENLYILCSHVPPAFLAGLKHREERHYLTVAALFGYHPCSFPPEALRERRRNLGESLRMLAMLKQNQAEEGRDDEADNVLPEPLKRRMEGILASSSDEVFGHLRQLVGLLKSGDIPVDWAQLLSDLKAWNWRDRPVQWEWSRSFYVGYVHKGGE